MLLDQMAKGPQADDTLVEAVGIARWHDVNR